MAKKHNYSKRDIVEILAEIQGGLGIYFANLSECGRVWVGGTGFNFLILHVSSFYSVFILWNWIAVLYTVRQFNCTEYCFFVDVSLCLCFLYTLDYVCHPKYFMQKYLQIYIKYILVQTQYSIGQGYSIILNIFTHFTTFVFFGWMYIQYYVFCPKY